MLRFKTFLAVLRPLCRIQYSNVCKENLPTPLSANTQLSYLPNGMRVVTETTQSSMACISLVAEAGSRYEKACNNGITHFIEHLVFKGFKTMTKTQLQDLLLSIGAKLSVHTSRELQIFSARCLPEDIGTIVDIFAKVIQEPAFYDCEIDAEKLNICLEHIDTDNDPKQVVFDYLHQTAYQGTPLAQPVIGPTRNLDYFDTFYCCSFVNEHYQPYKLAMVSSGCVDHCSMVDRVYSKFSDMIMNPNAESDEGPARYTGSQILFRDDSLPFAHVAIAIEAPGYTDKDYFPLLVASEILGSWDRNQGGGMNNPCTLAQAGSVAGLCERYESFYIPYRDTGLWGVYFVSKQMQVDDMLGNVQECWMELCTTVQYLEVQRAVNAVKLKLARNLSGVMGSCLDLGRQVMYRCDRLSLEDMYHLVEVVDHVTVKETLMKRLYDHCPVVAAAGPTEGLPDYTRIRAGMYWLRL